MNFQLYTISFLSGLVPYRHPKKLLLYRLGFSSEKKMSFLDDRSLNRFLPKSTPKNKILEFMQECHAEMKYQLWMNNKNNFNIDLDAIVDLGANRPDNTARRWERRAVSPPVDQPLSHSIGLVFLFFPFFFFFSSSFIFFFIFVVVVFFCYFARN